VVLVREGAVVVGLDPLRVVITASRIYVVTPPDDDNVLGQLRIHLKHAGALRAHSPSMTASGRASEWVVNPGEGSNSEGGGRGENTGGRWGGGMGRGEGCVGGSKFQEAAVGAVFDTVLEFYVAQVRLLAYTSVSVWTALRRRVSSAEMNKLQLLRVRLQDMLRQVEGVDTVIEALHSQADMEAACQDETGAGGAKRDEDEVGVSRVAWLLEEHMGEITALRSYLRNILEEMDDMRVLLQFQLLCSQNQLLRAEIGFQMATAWICVGGLIGGMFGMNFHNGFESSLSGPFAQQGDGWNVSGGGDSSSSWSPGAASMGESVDFDKSNRGSVGGGGHVIASWIWLEVVLGTTIGLCEWVMSHV